MCVSKWFLGSVRDGLGAWNGDPTNFVTSNKGAPTARARNGGTWAAWSAVDTACGFDSGCCRCRDRTMREARRVAVDQSVNAFTVGQNGVGCFVGLPVHAHHSW